MLSPDIEGLSPADVDVFLELHQLLPAAPAPPGAPTLYLHTGCRPGPPEEALAALLVDRRPWAGGANASADLALARGPLPAATAAADLVAGLSPRPAAVAVLAGYAARFPAGGHFRSRYDGVRQLNSSDAQASAAGARRGRGPGARGAAGAQGLRRSGLAGPEAPQPRPRSADAAHGDCRPPEARRAV